MSVAKIVPPAHAEIAAARDRMVEYLYHRLIGPVAGENETLFEPPYPAYSSGILFPQPIDPAHIPFAAPPAAADSADDVPDEAGGAPETPASSVPENTGDDPVSLANENLPACFGISFHLVGDPRLLIEVRAGAYRRVDPQTEYPDWTRTQLSTTMDDEWLSFDPPSADFPVSKQSRIFEGRALLHILWRRSPSGYLITVTVVNARAVSDEDEYINAENSLYQTELRIRPTDAAEILPSDRSRFLTDDPEEKILDLLYRRMQAYGVGHGCSVDWEPKTGRVLEVRSEFLPRHEVSAITYEVDERYLPKDAVDSHGRRYSRILSYDYLAGLENDPARLGDELDAFVTGYFGWISTLSDANTDIPPDLLPARNELLNRLDDAVNRMAEGVRLLRENEGVRRAFCLADRAMLLQRIHSTHEEYAGSKKAAGVRTFTPPDTSQFAHLTWRPFQLAFRLLVLASLKDPTDRDRNVVDLIWFPTGGGKTEAYLAVLAFVIFYRRLTWKDAGAGTAVIMRYTLRMLTGQQFERAASLICACELIRRECETEMGSAEISIGLWVGMSATPNDFERALEAYEDLVSERKPYTPFQIASCPWCGTELIPAIAGRLGDKEAYGYRAGSNSFEVFCPSDTCPFHSRLPVGVVDEQLYAQPPALLLATVDKFARLPWVDRAAEFFGGVSHIHRPPDLILQDELHLISGPLGTMVGLYEVAVDALASWCSQPPKVIASTATIRRAGEQCVGLYNRPVKLFPPSGLDADDSYFARTDVSVRGRLYVGFMSRGQSAATSMIRLSAALLQAPLEIESPAAIDKYSTLVAYHNNLRELGKTLTFALDDIPARLKVIADKARPRELIDERVEELTSNRTQGELVSIGERLKKNPDDPNSITFLVSSNMISVGVDFPRLGLMLVSGQPKSTSEYIQATGRVGRNFPGLVVTMLSPGRPRDRSHFERFIQYHSALYRYVEPGSVTPFSPPALDRGLHAVLVSFVRHALNLNSNEAAAQFAPPLEGLDWLLDYIVSRVEAVDPQERDEVARRLNELVDYWQHRAEKYTTLRYDKGKTALKGLIVNFENDRVDGAWRTMNNLRSVDKSVVLNVKKVRA